MSAMSVESAGKPAVMRGAVAGLKPLLLLLGVAGAVAAGVGVVLWSQGPSYSLLFGNLADSDAAQVTQSLDQAGITYKLEHGTGAILVPSDKVSDARLKLAAKGLPGTGGFSLMEKDPGFGVSQFMENARYQHALETELARTIAGLDPVQGARVHLAVPQQSAFVRDRRPTSASVFLQLRSGRRLEREQITSIVNLVASSVPELGADQVTVVDSQGRLLSAPDKNSEFAAREEQLEIANRMEEDYSHRIESLLTPLLGPGRVRAQVVAQIEMASSEEAREQYRPESQIIRSEQTSEESSRGGNGAQGVPGALTNTPPEGGTALPAAGAPPKVPAAKTPVPAAGAAATETASTTPDNTSRQSTKNYEIDRTVAYTRQPAGRLQRLSVAVLIDNLRTTGADGKVTETALTADQVTRITTLVRDAVGFDETRGDRVSVMNQSFLPEAAVAAGEIESTPIWEKPLVRDIAKIASGLLIVVLLLMFVLRPLVRSLTAAAKAAMETPALPAGAAGATLAGAVSGPGNTIAYEQQIAQARSLVARDPARVAQVVKGWVEKDE
jgi:flagellar M-ring protein FliF